MGAGRVTRSGVGTCRPVPADSGDPSPLRGAEPPSRPPLPRVPALGAWSRRRARGKPAWLPRQSTGRAAASRPGPRGPGTAAQSPFPVGPRPALAPAPAPPRPVARAHVQPPRGGRCGEPSRCGVDRDLGSSASPSLAARPRGFQAAVRELCGQFGSWGHAAAPSRPRGAALLRARLLLGVRSSAVFLAGPSKPACWPFLVLVEVGDVVVCC